MASKSKSRRRVLRASCLLAALIVAGSSFAWFTSKDEVTNRLSASADYGVTIAEDFTPPENWLPGQKVDKNVGVVNTGNVDAFVRTWLEGEMDLLAEKRDQEKWDGTKFAGVVDLATTANYNPSTKAVTGLTKTDDEKLNALGMTYYYGDVGSRYYFKELSTEIHQNPNSPTNTPSNPADFNEVMTVQAGGVLAYLKTGAGAGDTVFFYKPNQGMTIKTDDTAATPESGTLYTLKGDTQYKVVIDASSTVFDGTTAPVGDTIYVDNTASAERIVVADEAAIIKYLGNYIDSDNFYPAETGLYVFRRNADKDKNTNNPTISDYEFSGYYYVETSDDSEIGWNTDAATTFGNQGKYFALQNDTVDTTQRSNYVLAKDTYTVIRDAEGNVSFVPSCQTVTEGGKTYYKVGTSYYDENGYLLDATTTPTATAASSYSYGTENTVTLFTAQQNVLEYADLTWNLYRNATATLTGEDYTYNGATGEWTKDSDGSAADASDVASLNATKVDADNATLVAQKDDVKINIKVVNLGIGAEQWTVKSATGTPNKYTFYYNNDVEEGCTTSRLVEDVTLDSSVDQDDYIAFDFDLNVLMESQQVTITDTGVEAGANITPTWAASGNAVAANSSITNDGSEISLIAWS